MSDSVPSEEKYADGFSDPPPTNHARDPSDDRPPPKLDVYQPLTEAYEQKELECADMNDTATVELRSDGRREFTNDHLSLSEKDRDSSKGKVWYLINSLRQPIISTYRGMCGVDGIHPESTIDGARPPSIE